MQKFAMVDSWKYRCGLKTALVILCFAGFFFNVRKEWGKYSSDRAAVGVSFDTVKRFRLPTLAFCPTEGFLTCEPGVRGTEKKYRDYITE